MTKRSFILLEVLIALALVSLCAVPLILRPIKAYRSEIVAVRSIEKERIADWTFSEIKEQMMNNQIPWEKLPKHRELTGPFYLDASFIQIPGKQREEIRRSFTLYGKGEKEGMGGEVYRMVYVKVELDSPFGKEKKSYSYRTVVQRILKKESFQSSKSFGI